MTDMRTPGSSFRHQFLLIFWAFLWLSAAVMACSSACVLSVVDFGFEFGVSCFLFFFGGRYLFPWMVLFKFFSFCVHFLQCLFVCFCFVYVLLFFLLIVPNPTPSRKSPSKPAACSLIPLFFRIYLWGSRAPPRHEERITGHRREHSCITDTAGERFTNDAGYE